MSPFQLSAFGDEIAGRLEDQLATLNDLNIDGLELRSAWGVNVRDLSDAQVARVRALCADHGVTVRCLGSPLGKSPLAAPIEQDVALLQRLAEIAHALGTTRIRIFSWYPDDTSSNAHYDQYVPLAAERLARLAEVAGAAGVLLLHENEREIVGDTPARSLALVQAVDSPHLRLIWDPANYVQVGVAELMTRWWQSLAPYVAYIHIKDARLSDQGVTPAGQGDGQLPELLAALHASGYVREHGGVLALEPHLKVAGHSGGFSGPDGMQAAVTALRDLLAALPD